MPALDTNALVRYVVEDDVAQLAAAKRLIRKCVSEGQTLFVPVTVTLELEWVLRSSFEYAKDEVMQALSNLFSAAELTFESERALEVALQLYREGSADFADCLHVALAAAERSQQRALARSGSGAHATLEVDDVVVQLGVLLVDLVADVATQEHRIAPDRLCPIDTGARRQDSVPLLDAPQRRDRVAGARDVGVSHDAKPETSMQVSGDLRGGRKGQRAGTN